MSLFHARPVPVDALQRHARYTASDLVYSSSVDAHRSAHPANSLGSPAKRRAIAAPLAEQKLPAIMDRPANSRDPASSKWPTHSPGSSAHASGREHMQGAVGASTSDANNNVIAAPADNSQLPYQANASDRALDHAHATTGHASIEALYSTRAPSTSIAAGQQASTSNVQADGTTPSQQPVTRPVVSATRARIFDPARDLNPTDPLDLRSSPSSSVQPSSRSDLRQDNFIERHHSMGQALSSCLSGSSTLPPTRSGREDPLPETQSRYQLEVIEHPVAVRASTYGDRDRRVINPPPILRMSLKDYNDGNPDDRRKLIWPYNIVTCTLWRVTGVESPQSDWIEVTEYTGRDSPRQGGLMGTLVANPMIVEAPNADYDDESSGPPACFYVFSDLSCRTTGVYRLRFGLTTIGDDFYKQVGARSPIVSSCWTDPFEVYSAKDFPGVRPSSRLLRYLKHKGANVTIKKEKDGPANDLARKRARATTAETGFIPTSNVDAKRTRALADAQMGGGEVMPLGLGYPDQNGPDD